MPGQYVKNLNRPSHPPGGVFASSYPRVSQRLLASCKHLRKEKPRDFSVLHIAGADCYKFTNIETRTVRVMEDCQMKSGRPKVSLTRAEKRN